VPDRESAAAGVPRNRDASSWERGHSELPRPSARSDGRRQTRQVANDPVSTGFSVRGELPGGRWRQRRIGIEPEAEKARDGERLELRPVRTRNPDDGAHAPVIHQETNSARLLRDTGNRSS